MKTISTLEELRDHYGEPSERSLKKQMTRLDRHARAFLEKSPFVLIGSSSPGRLPDVSPKGDAPGFVVVIDDRTIAIPDRPGNKRLDTYENVIADPAVGLLFLIPGMDETLRINGRATISIDDDLLEQTFCQGRKALSALVVSVEEVYLHCPKAFMRSKLWDAASFIERGAMPSMGAMLKDQIGLAESAADLDGEMAARHRATMY